jgi:hypothetical protein
MRRLAVWLREQPVRLHALLTTLVTANVIALFFLSWSTGLALQATSLLVALILVVYACRRSRLS